MHLPPLGARAGMYEGDVLVYAINLARQAVEVGLAGGRLIRAVRDLIVSQRRQPAEAFTLAPTHTPILRVRSGSSARNSVLTWIIDAPGFGGWGGVASQD